MTSDKQYRIVKNPARKNQFNLFFENFSNVSLIEIDIYTLSGENVYSNWFDISGFKHSVHLPETFPTGKYVIRVKIDSQFQQDEFLFLD